MLADFCFADLLLYAPTRDGGWVVLGQVRPVTSQTLYLADWVGRCANDAERPLLADGLRLGRDHRRRDHGRGHRRAGAGRGHPGAPRRLGHRRAHPGVVAPGRPPARRAGAHLPRDLPPLRRHDRRRLVPVRSEQALTTATRSGGRRRDGARRRRPGHLRLAERGVGAAPRRHQRQRRRPAPGRAGLRRRTRAPGLRPPRARHRGVRPGARDHAGHPLHPAARLAAR